MVLGGGPAGLFAARALRRSPVAVTVVGRRAHHLFQPLLHRCASGILSEGQIAQPLRWVLRRHHNVSRPLAEATDVDVRTRLVHARRPGRRRSAGRHPYGAPAKGRRPAAAGLRPRRACPRLIRRRVREAPEG
ncbi:FAD-dependent oxidoreductase [Streptomyces sp. NPDC050388]|uniref:FAD-dependent oxidoreductase n=1 Tax=Streptomyces sp. NPDC050388 TaxID=3155781 RepID=UPI0034357B36